MTDTPRRPRAFKVTSDDDPEPVAAATPQPTTDGAATSDTSSSRPRAFQGEAFEFDPEPEADPDTHDATGVEALPSVARPKQFPWLGLLLGGLGALLSIVAALALERLVANLFASSPILGWLGAGLVTLIAISLVGLIGREVLALRRLRSLDGFRDRALRLLKSGRNKDALRFQDDLVDLYAERPGTVRGRAGLADCRDDVMDARDRLILAERYLLEPLDANARQLVLSAARRVSLVTVLSPRTLVDIAFVLVMNIRLIGALGRLYGARPGMLGFLRLLRHVMGHLAITGGIAVTDSVIEQFIGQGLATRLSARLGESLVNGLLTARIGVAAIEVTRPMPFIDGNPLKLRDVLNDLGNLADKSEKSNAKAAADSK